MREASLVLAGRAGGRGFESRASSGCFGAGGGVSTTSDIVWLGVRGRPRVRGQDGVHLY